MKFFKSKKENSSPMVQPSGITKLILTSVNTELASERLNAEIARMEQDGWYPDGDPDIEVFTDPDYCRIVQRMLLR